MLRKTICVFWMVSVLSGSLGTSKAMASVNPVVRADKILVEKAQRRMTLLQNGKTLRSYRIALGRNPVGPKTQQGDSKTPEGTYFIDYKNPQSAYRFSLHISYPDARDKARAARRGVSAGGNIMIHGLPNGAPDVGAAHSAVDWTDGCIAVTNEEIEEIDRLVPLKTKIEIRP